MNYSKLSSKELKAYVATSNPESPALLGSQKELDWRRTRMMFVVGSALTIVLAVAGWAWK